ncbi:hypothetical protein PRUPE_6G221500 [Prunus persica]|uniref:NPH3 domain-containing protein n=1 Tax=Prunus persica TaxID=3760 RepID=A0A251NTX8_PRUPE|nr:BTB/POZ domain-containing protein At3g49900 [Prunus persica]ONI02777.1 hypothetical protein PRUPE_6G221500 [Prunus persica]
MRGWRNLGVVETIYEEEDYEFSSASPSLSPALSSPCTPLHSRVESWSRATGHKAEVLIRVQGKCFHLHKDALTSRSTYLKRQLTDFVSDFALPLNISAETFTLVAEFCYGAHLVITLLNLAALRTAAELLEMTESNCDGDDNLLHLTDTYFRQVVAVNRDYASVVFRSCLSLLPEAETAAFLVSGCIEAFALSNDGDGGADWLNEVITVRPEDFQIVAEAIQRSFGNHDVVYKLADLYIVRYNEKITEDEKTQICSSIDCSKLSPQVLLDAVQNPIMPLRFIVRAMLIEQLNTRRTIISAAAAAVAADHTQIQPHDHHDNKKSIEPTGEATTLGSLLQRDTMIRQSAQLRATMAATSSRIQSLEEELNGMKKLLDECHEKKENSILLEDGRRSASFHYGTHENSNKITKGDKASASSASFRILSGKGSTERSEGTSNWSSSCKGTPRSTKKISERLINGLKKAFRVSGSAKEAASKDKIIRYGGDIGYNKDEAIVIQ